MARSLQGPRQVTTWAAEQNPRPMPRIVRIGRPANDNIRPAGGMTRALISVFVALLAVLGLAHWRVF